MQDAVVKTLESSAYDGNGTLTLNFTEDNLTSIEAGVPYIVKWNVVKIASKADWEAFAARVNRGETMLNAVLTADITEAVATSVGNELYPYAGTFDGQGHRLTLGISGTSRVDAFGNILDASISNLIVDGEVTVSGKFGGSIVGSTNGNCTLDHCVSEATVRTTGTASSYDATCGGMVGINISGTLNITNCAFYGTLDFSNGSYDNGGFVGWSGGTTNLTNCVFSPEEIIGGDEEGYIRGCKTFVRNYTNATFTNCYYTELLGGVSGGNQGEYTTESGDNLQALHGGYPTTSISTLAQNVVEPVFKNVTISSTPAQTISTTDGTTNWVDFVGTYSPTTLEKENRTVLYLGSNNTLYYPSANVKVNSFRAYFQLKNGLTAGDPNSSEGIRSMNINFGQETTTGILELPHDIPSTIDYWFSLDGRRLSDKPSHKGIYIQNGKKVMIQ